VSRRLRIDRRLDVAYRPAVAGVLLILLALPCPADQDSLLMDYVDQGTRLLAQGAPEEALRAFNEALAIRTDVAARLGHAIAQLLLGRRTEAESEFRGLTAVSPAPAAVGQALCALASGELVACRAYLSEAQEFGYDRADIVQSLAAYCALLEGHYGESGQLAQSALAEEPAGFLALLTLAETDLASGRAARAGDRVRSVEALKGRGVIRPGHGPKLASPDVVITGRSPVIGMGNAPITGRGGAKRIEITSPLNGAVVRGDVPVCAALISDEKAACVTIAVNGTMVFTTSQPPYRCVWDARDRVPGDYTITAAAKDGIDGDVLYEDRVTVRVMRGADPGAGGIAAPDEALVGRLMAVLVPEPSDDWLASITQRLVALSNYDPSARQPTLPEGWAPAELPTRRTGAVPVPRPAGGQAEPVFPIAGGPSSSEPIPSVPHVSGRKMVALLLDDGPHPIITPAILRVLRQENVRGAFFLVGSQAEQYPELVRQIASEGHDVGNHTYHHVNLDGLLQPEIEREILDNRLLLQGILGRPVNLFRAPGEHSGPRVRGVVSSNGLIVVPSTENTWPLMALSPEEIVARIAATAHDGSLVLLHNGQDKSIYCLPLLIRKLRDAGFEFASVSEMLADPHYQQAFGPSSSAPSPESMAAGDQGAGPSETFAPSPVEPAAPGPLAPPSDTRPGRLGARRPTGQ